jgi:GDP/UDP-N,N'-diacetylbacillosamine 2-epimerase (hydrolysing)
MNKKNIFLITSSRADYGIFKELILSLQKIKKINFDLIITGSHFSRKSGFSFNEIEKDNVKKFKKIKIPDKNSKPVDIIKVSLRLIEKISVLFKKNKLDYIIVLGDRFEIFLICYVATIFSVKIIHISGGDITKGSDDDKFRFSISKMSNFHFVTNEKSEKELLKINIKENCIFNFGNLSLNNIKNFVPAKKRLIENKFKIKFNKKNFLVTFHPSSSHSFLKNINDFKILLRVLRKIKNTSFIFTSANLDLGGDQINNLIKDFVKKNENAFFIKSFGRYFYFSTLKYIDCVIGNSSSGLTEVPSFGIGTLNIGDRQQGRLSNKSIINVNATEIDIYKGIKFISSNFFKKNNKLQKNIYEKKDILKNYVEELKKIFLDSNYEK